MENVIKKRVMNYQNPVIPGFHPDPSICKVGEDFYLVTSSFEYFPGVPIFHSRDLVNWKQIGYCLTRESQLNLNKCPPSSGIWAPTLRYHQGTFYMITTNYNAQAKKDEKGYGKFFVKTTDPTGEWSEPIFIDQPGIDPDLFFDDDGKVYVHSNDAFTDSKGGVYQVEIDIETGEVLSENTLIHEGTGGIYPEGPHLYKIDGWYFLLMSEGGSQMGHYISISRSKSVSGPFENCPRREILTHKDRPGEAREIQGTGHADLIQAEDGSWWMVFLAFRHSEAFFYHLGRETYLSPIKWEDGWPVVLNPGEPDGTVSTTVDYKPLAPQKEQVTDIVEKFDQSELAPYWNYLRNPISENYAFGNPNGLTLTANSKSINDIDASTLLCIRQQAFESTASTKIDFSPIQKGDEAGLIIFYNHEQHYEVFITNGENGHEIQVRRSVGDLSSIVAKHSIQDNKAELCIKSDRLNYYLGYMDNSKFTQLASGRSRYLSTESTLCSFTGVFYGLYCTSKNDTKAKANFSEFKLKY